MPRESERGYMQRNKEMKVVFSPNLHPSVYPGTSAFYCDRATCTRAERVHNMKDRLDRSCTLPIARIEYEWRDKEMKVVFSPNLNLSAYPSTSAFYCDRATCTRAERVHNMKDRLDRSCTLPIARFEYEWRDKEMKVVFSPNLHLSAYPSTSAFYCDRATCTRQESTKIKLPQLDHIPSIYPDPSAFY